MRRTTTSVWTGSRRAIAWNSLPCHGPISSALSSRRIAILGNCWRRRSAAVNICPLPSEAWSGIGQASQPLRRFAVWTDRVEHQVVRRSYTDLHGLRKAYRFLRDNIVASPVMKHLARYIVARCDLGLFHGLDCFNAYSPYCRNAHLVHNIHLKPEDRIGPEQLRQKLARIQSGTPLRLIYAGRVAGMKGPVDWVRVMADLRGRGLSFQASWIGDGPLQSEVEDEVLRLNLSEMVKFPGHVSDRSQLMEAVRDSDLFIFCHKTPESPRCLIEALMSACPILGYSSSYPQDLLGDLAGRLLVDRDDTVGLANRIFHFHSHRAELAEVVQSCYQLGAKFSDRAVFEHRSNLIKDHLGRPGRASAQTTEPASRMV